MNSYDINDFPDDVCFLGFVGAVALGLAVAMASVSSGGWPMSESDFEQPDSGVHEEQTGGSEREVAAEPAVGLVATPDNGAAIATSILRARRHGYDAYVTYTEEADNEGLAFAWQLEATVVTPPGRNVEPDVGDLRQLLAGAADVGDSRGLIFVSQPDRRVDFDRSIAELGEATLCEAVYETEADRTRQQPAVMIGIPAYNEATTVGDVVASAKGYADTVLVVDDGSDDDTARRAREAGATVVEHEFNSGYGAALQTLFREADDRGVDHLAVVDADGQHDPSDVPEMVERQRDTGAELVIGSRFTDGGRTDAPLYRQFGLSVINVLTNLSMGVVRPSSRVSDTQCGFRVYSRSAVASLAANGSIGEGMSASTDILYHAHSNDFDIEEVGTTVDYDVDNASSRNPFTHGIGLIRNILATIERERPFLILGIPGFLAVLAGIGFGYWAITAYIARGSLPLGPSVGSMFLGLGGIFATFTAIILHSLDQHLNQ